MKKYEEVEKINILGEKAAGFFTNLNKFHYNQTFLDFKKDIQDNLVMSGQEISDDVAGFLDFTVKDRRPKSILEIGTFAGFSTLVIARACPLQFQITTIDVNNDPVEIGKKYWNKEGFGENINFIKGRAGEVLDRIDEKFDFIFIDADKKGTLDYFKKSIDLLDHKGLIVIDNIWLGGEVLDPKRDMHFSRLDFLNYIEGETGINKYFLPVGDGLLLVTLDCEEEAVILG